MSLFLIIFMALPLADAAWWWWADRAVRDLPRATWWRALVAIFSAVQLVGYLWVVGSRFALPWSATTMPPMMLASLFLWHLLIVPVVGVSMLIGAVARGALLLLRRPRPTMATEPSGASAGAALSRRQLLKAVAVAAPPIVTAGAVVTSLFQLRHFRVNRLTVPLANLPAELDGMTIAQVSDIHVGRFSRGQLLTHIVETTNALRPDVVLMTGDLIDFSLRDLPAGIDLVRKLDPRHGLFTVEGNHDLFEDRSAFENGVRAAGVPLLLNESQMVRVRGYEVQLLGIKWGGRSRRASQFDEHLDATLPLLQRGGGVFPILLAHHPHAFDRAADAGIPLTLAGHTHGGQLMLTDHLGPGPMMFKYWSGLYRRGNSALVVSNGVGNWFPLRINAPAEIVHITLRRAG